MYLILLWNGDEDSFGLFFVEHFRKFTLFYICYMYNYDRFQHFFPKEVIYLKDLPLEKNYLTKVNSVINHHIRELEIEYSNYSPYIYAVGDMINDWEFEMKKMNALRAKQTYPLKIDRLTKLKNSPFFGKIFMEDELGKAQYYIGEEDIHQGDRQMVISWRSEYGDLFYKKLPVVVKKDGNRVKVFRTRNFTIKNGQLLEYKDYEIIHINDEDADLLKAYKHYISSDFLQNQLVNRNAQKLKPIFQTIDQFQNEIIRMPLNKNVLVQGVSGSGKTTMGLQRLSYIMYQYEKKNVQSKILAICPNHLFLDYIQELVPNLNLSNVSFTSVQDLFRTLLPKGIKIAKSKIREDLTYHFLHSLQVDKRNMYAEWFQYKGSSDYLTLLEEFVWRLKRNAFHVDYSPIHPLLSKNLMFNIFEKLKQSPYNIMLSRAVNFIEQILEVKDKEKKDTLMPIIKKEFMQKKWNAEKVYITFLKTATFYRKDFSELNKKQSEWYEEDIPALIYLSYLLDNVNGKQKDFNHVFVDEAQDLTYIQYSVLKKIYNEASFTIVGDLNQQIFLQRGINSWEYIRSIYNCELLTLEYNYRSSKEIMDLASSCLIDATYTGSGVLETGVKPVQIICNNRQSISYNWSKINQLYIEKWLKKKESIAIITNSIKESESIEQALKEIGVIQTNVIRTTENTLDNSKITIISSLLVKGLEFNHVIVHNPSEREYPYDSYFSKLLYMVITRALYNIVISVVDPPTKLLLKADLEYKFESKQL